MPSLTLAERIRRMFHRRRGLTTAALSLKSATSVCQQESVEGLDAELDTAAHPPCAGVVAVVKGTPKTHTRSDEAKSTSPSVPCSPALRREMTPDNVHVPRELLGPAGLLSLQRARVRMGLAVGMVDGPHLAETTKTSGDETEITIFQQSVNINKRSPSVNSEPEVALLTKAEVEYKGTPVTSHENPTSTRPTLLWMEEKSIAKAPKPSPIMVQLTKFSKRASPNVTPTLRC